MMPDLEGIEGIDGVEGLGAIENIVDEELGNLGVPDSNARRNAARRVATKMKQPIRKANAVGVRKGFQKGKTSTQTATSITGAITSKGWFELKKAELPADVQQGLANKTLQVVDSNIYGVKPIVDKQVIDLLTSSDDKSVGKSNINGAKLDIGEHFLVTAICLDFGQFDVAAGETAADALFGADFPAKIRNGEFELKIGAETLLPENLSCEVFANETITSEKFHVFKMENPKWIRPQMEIKPRLTMTKSGEAGEAVKLTLMGCRVHKK